MALRKTLLVSLDDLLAVLREVLNPHVSRSGLDRCLRRHSVGNLRDLQVRAARPKHSGFKAHEPGYIHVDVKYRPQIVARQCGFSPCLSRGNKARFTRRVLVPEKAARFFVENGLDGAADVRAQPILDRVKAFVARK